jgi:putative Flp pilus-assembly TadE/G-like protein
MKPADLNVFRQRRAKEGGQSTVLVLLALSIFLLGAVGLAVDVSNWWFHRQMAQGAADAACTAGVMDLLVSAQGGTWNNAFTPGTAFDCTASGIPGASPCAYAALNGYNSVNSVGGNLVSVSFPPSVPGVTPPPTSLAPVAFIRADVLDHVRTNFTGLLSGSSTQDVRAFATCGLILAESPIPIIVLDPISPVSTPPQSALNIQGNGTIAIVGGPTKSIQVDSAARDATCGQSDCSINLPWGSAQIDLSKAGPDGTGADMGLSGYPPTGSSQIPSGFIPGTGHWVSPASPVSDPFARVCAPGQTGCPAINGLSAPGVPDPPSFPADIDSTHGLNSSGNWPCSSTDIQNGNCFVTHNTHGCPDPNATAPTPAKGCVLYTAGVYPSEIAVGPGGSAVAIFDPGLYYVTGGLTLKSGSTVRPGTGTGDGSQGVTFYFAGSGAGAGTVTVVDNSGTKPGLDPFNTTSGTGSMANGVKCTSTSTIPSNLPAQIPADPSKDGANILLGPCTGYYGDPLGAADTLGIQRGFVFFQDRSGTSISPKWGGGGQFLLAGTMYFHSCNADGTGVNCVIPPSTPRYYNDIFKLLGNSGSGTYVLGSIVTDNLTLGGTSGITMDLNPTKYFTTLKATLLQ